MINVTIKATNMKLTPSIREYVENKVGSFEKLVDPDDTTARADVEVGQTTRHHQSGDIFRAEINLVYSQGILRAVSEQEDLYAAIDESKDEILRQLRKDKTKRAKVRRRGGQVLKSLLRRFGNE